MTKRQIKKEGYKQIVKNGKSHQEVYESLKTTKPAFNVTIADLLSKIPSRSKVESQKVVRITYLILISLLIIIRGIGLSVVSSQLSMNSGMILFVLLIVLIIPGIGIFALLTNRMETLRGTSFFFVISIVRSLDEIDFKQLDQLIWLLPMIGVILLGLWIPKLLESKYTKTVVHEMIDGKKRVDYKIQFEKGKSNLDDNILDSDLD